MISGVMTIVGCREIGYPYDLALRCWSRVCDEIVVVTQRDLQTPIILDEMASLSKQFGLNIRVKAVEAPPLLYGGSRPWGNFGLYNLIGIYLANNPDWVVLCEADFLISPYESGVLREYLNDNLDWDVATLNMHWLNYLGTRLFATKSFRQHNPPYTGYSAERPVVVNPRRSIFPAFFRGVDADGVNIDEESVVGFTGPTMGGSFNTKFGSNPRKMRVLKTECVGEHLMWTLNPTALKERLHLLPWIDFPKILDFVLAGSRDYKNRYPELDEVAERYRDYESHLREEIKRGFGSKPCKYAPGDVYLTDGDL